MYLYTNDSGVTRYCLGCLPRVLPRLGRITEVRGELLDHDEAVVVEGTHGRASLNGFRWGYGGEGPQGTIELLERLGVPKDVARRIAFKTPIGEAWELRF